MPATKNAFVRLITATAMVGILCLNMDLAAKPPAAAKQTAKASGAKKGSAGHLANPHLHGVRAVLDRHRRWDRYVSGYWYNRWSYTTWRGTHWGLGTIEGEVFDANGSRVTGAVVTLRTAKGKMIGDPGCRHTTVSNNGGVFVMSRVRGGTYRVNAGEGENSGHTLVAVHAGQVSAVSVKL